MYYQRHFFLTAPALEHSTALLPLTSSPRRRNRAPTHSLFPGLSGSRDEAQGCLWHPAQPQASCQIASRGEACMPSTACLHHPPLLQGSSVSPFSKKQRKSATKIFSSFFPSQIPLAPLLKPPQEKKDGGKKKSCSFTSHPTTSVFPPAKEPRSDMATPDRQGGSLLTQLTLGVERQKTWSRGCRRPRGAVT